MKVGILTFHSQINYGALLQTYALQTYYRSCGCDVVVIDRWLDKNNAHLLGMWQWSGIRGVIRNVFYCIYGVGYVSDLVRRLKTMWFVRKCLRLTSYHFYEWIEAPKDLGVDMISVGSDQVWNANLFPPGPYLLEGAPVNVPAIAYAASIGMLQLPIELIKQYDRGFARFTAISCREKRACCLVEGRGFSAVHVVDPTLLVDNKCWEEVVNGVRQNPRKIVFYVLAEDFWKILPKLEAFARLNRLAITVLLENFHLNFSKSPRGLMDCLRTKWRLLVSPVEIKLACDPFDFVREIYSSMWVITNSFHALMFSVVFKRQIRIIEPADSKRKLMHDRMREFIENFGNGSIMSDTVDAALTSLLSEGEMSFDDASISQMRNDSRAWLNSVLNV